MINSPLRDWTSVAVVLLALSTAWPSQAQTGDWTTLTAMPTARLGLAACEWDGLIYVIGGYAAANAPGLVQTEVYDPDTDSWSTLAPMPTGRRWLACAAVDGKIYSIGGFTGVSEPALPTVEIYNIATDSWASGTPMLTGRKALAVSVVAGKIYAFGGADPSESRLGTAEMYNPATDTWSFLAPMPEAKAMIASAAIGGLIYVAGGPWPGESGSRKLDVYDTNANTWTSLTDMSRGRWSLGLEAFEGAIIAVGGANGTSATSTVEMYAPSTHSWTSTASLPTPPGLTNGRRSGLATVIADGALYAIGGTNNPAPPHPGINVIQRYGSTPVKTTPSPEIPAVGSLNIYVYPNPSHGALTVEFTSAVPSEISVILVDVLGRTVLDRKVHIHGKTDRLTFTAGQLAAGTYLLAARTLESYESVVVHLLDN